MANRRPCRDGTLDWPAVKIWIVKQGLTHGIVTATARITPRRWAVVTAGPARGLYAPTAWVDSLDAAILHVEQVKEKRINSLEKQLARLKKQVVFVHEEADPVE